MSHLATALLRPFWFSFIFLKATLRYSIFTALAQILVLWDRIIGFDSLLVLPVLAAAIFTFRSQALLKAETVDEVFDVFSDPSRLKIIPLLQHFLFQT